MIKTYNKKASESKNELEKVNSPNDRINFFMEKLKLKTKDIAEKLGVHYSTVNQIIKRENKVTSLFALALKAEYNLNPEWLYKGKSPMFCFEKSTFIDNKQKNLNEIYFFINEDRKNRLLEYAHFQKSLTIKDKNQTISSIRSQQITYISDNLYLEQKKVNNTNKLLTCFQEIAIIGQFNKASENINKFNFNSKKTILIPSILIANYNIKLTKCFSIWLNNNDLNIYGIFKDSCIIIKPTKTIESNQKFIYLTLLKQNQTLSFQRIEKVKNNYYKLNINNISTVINDSEFDIIGIMIGVWKEK